MKAQYILLLFLIIFLLTLGCSEDSPTGLSSNVFKYKAYNSEGKSIISGFLTIEQDSASYVKGIWHFVPIGNCNNIGPQIGSGKLVGNRVDGNRLLINLNPNIADNNITLEGEYINGHYEGTWSYYGFPGLINRGTFEAYK
jgi:hypothetical protein